MSTLTKDDYKIKVIGDINEIPMIAADIIYEGAAVGIVTASGHARPLTSVDKFVGFANVRRDNSAGAAAAKKVRVLKNGVVKLSVSGAVITDKGQPVFATDDDTFVFLPTGAVFIGFVENFISSGVVEVRFDAASFIDPYLKYGGVYETLAASTLTLDVQDNAKVIFITVDAVVTLPAVAVPVDCTLVNMGAYSTVQISVDPDSNDLIHAPNIAGTINKDHINTKASAQRGDLVQTSSGAGDADGPIVRNQIGTWAQEG